MPRTLVSRELSSSFNRVAVGCVSLRGSVNMPSRKLFEPFLHNNYFYVHAMRRRTYLHVSVLQGLASQPFRLQSTHKVAARHQSTWSTSHKSLQNPSPCNAVEKEKSSSSASLDPEFLEELKLHIDSFPLNTWIALTDLYEKLSENAKKVHIRPHKTLYATLRLAGDALGITLHKDGVFWSRGASPSTHYAVKMTSESRNEPTLAVSQNNSSRRVYNKVLPNVAAKNPSSPLSPLFMADETLAVDFFYNVGLQKYPPPPPDFFVTPSSLASYAEPKDDGSVIALKSFVAYIPYFFVPLAEVLKRMPGYTEEHIEKYFKSPAVEMVQIEGQRFIRLFGGYGRISLNGCEASEETFQSYKPDLSLAEHFVKAFDGLHDKWMPLNFLLKRVSPDVIARMPYKGSAAIIYFAQMQHIFAFAVDPKEGGAVLLRQPGFGGLDASTTPTPKCINFIIRFLPLEGTCDIAQLEKAIPVPMKEEIRQYYGTLSSCLDAHGPLFYVEENVVMLTSYKRRLHVASLSLEEQLSIALQKREKAKVRSLRRRIAFRDDPSHAFHDPENLAREINRLLPRKGFVSVKHFMKRTVPEEMLFFMPRKTHNFFVNHPQYFTIFEFQHANNWCICRPEEPLPKGVIRQDFSERDILRLIAQLLQQRGPLACTSVGLHIPKGASDIVKKRFGGMYHFVTKYPEYFNVILGSETRNAMGSGVIHLLRIPGAELTDSLPPNSDSGINSSIPE